MTVSLIVAMSENGVIGHEGDMPWRMSEDLKRFKRLTMGHHLIMGRTTWESIGRVLPGRTTIILTRNADYRVEDALMARDLDHALELAAGDDEVFVIGGGEVYRFALPYVTKMYVTRVHAELQGDTLFPDVDWDQWSVDSSTMRMADEKNQYNYSFEDYERKSRPDE